MANVRKAPLVFTKLALKKVLEGCGVAEISRKIREDLIESLPDDYDDQFLHVCELEEGDFYCDGNGDEGIIIDLVVWKAVKLDEGPFKGKVAEIPLAATKVMDG
jgi:hypothetical protein